VGTIRKRPNPAVAQSEREAQSAESIADIAGMNVMGPLQGLSTATATRALANRRRAGANKIKKERPYLIETED
jgi:hypothetical protein